MIRTLLKLAFVALLANATWHIFGAFAPHYRLVDAVRNASQFRGDLTDAALQEKVLFLASQFDVPITEDDVKITHDAAYTTIDAAYLRPIEVVPGYTYKWPFTIHVETLNSRPPAGDPLR
jgi:hypothetical protein